MILTNAIILADGYNLSADHNRIALAYEIPEKRDNTFGDVALSHAPGLPGMSVNGRGFFKAGANEIDPTLFAQLGLADKLLSIFADGVTEGTVTDKGYAFLMMVGKYSPLADGQHGELLPFDLAASCRGALPVRAIPMKNALVTPINASGNGVAFNLGAVSANQKLYAGLHVVGDPAGTNPTLDVTIESDDAQGFPSATTRITFTQMTARGAQYATPVDGAITDTWWRAKWTLGGADNPSFLALVWLAIQ